MPKSFSAVLYDGDANLQAPLLEQKEKVVAPTISPRTLKMLSLVSGAAIALFSQYILSKFLWDESILTKSTLQIVLFSLNWSFWTCLVVFSSMLLIVTSIRRKYLDAQIKDEQLLDDKLFQMEAHYVVAALFTISAAWLLNDVTEIAQVQIHPVLTITAAGLAYTIFFRYVMQKENAQEGADAADKQNGIDSISSSNSSMMPTYRLVAATLGLIVGVCSQFILSLVLWKDHMTVPAVNNVIYFSLLWSVLTVTITFGGCMSLRLLLVGGSSSDSQRALLRMEAVYISCSLVGICMAWILIDVLAGMPEQVLPSMFLLIVSLFAFQVILKCFPEDKCLAYEPTTTKDNSDAALVVLQVV